MVRLINLNAAEQLSLERLSAISSEDCSDRKQSSPRCLAASCVEQPNDEGCAKGPSPAAM